MNNSFTRFPLLLLALLALLVVVRGRESLHLQDAAFAYTAADECEYDYECSLDPGKLYSKTIHDIETSEIIQVVRNNPHSKIYPSELGGNGKEFPITLEAVETLDPKTQEKTRPSSETLGEWIENHRDGMLELAKEHGAILLRGFNAPKPEDFATVIESLNLHNMPYVGGAAVRRNVVGDIVFTANESPPTEPIPFHHEMAQVPDPPRYVMFYCETPPKEGGETPMIQSHIVYNFFKENYPQVCEKVEKLGVRYVRTMPEEDDPRSAIGRSWKSTFQVQTREEAENQMREIGTEWEWMPSGDLKTITRIVPAIRGDPRSGKKMFFNSMVAAFTGWIDSRNDPTKAVKYADGSTIDPDALNGVASFMEKQRVQLPWQSGDILIIDNTVTMHSRNPFTPPRRILASVAKGPKVFRKPTTNAMASMDAKDAIPTVKLHSGDEMPRIGFGFWKVPENLTAQLVVDAIKQGYRHLDCAADYGNERQVGEGIKQAISEGIVNSRDELFVVSKLWNTYHGEHVEAALNKSLQDLGLDYVDLYMIHFPIPLKFVPFETRYPPGWIHDPRAENPRMEPVKIPLQETWRQMENLVVNGKARNIGVCNFSIQLLRDLLSYAKFWPCCIQVELHPRNTQANLVRFAQENKIAVTAFSPLGAASYVPIGLAQESHNIMDHPVVRDQIAARHGITPAQVLLRWALQRGTSVVVKTTRKERIAENLKAAQFSPPNHDQDLDQDQGFNLTEAEMNELDQLNQNLRFNDPGYFAQTAFNTFYPIY